MKQIWCGVLCQPLLQQSIPNRTKTEINNAMREGTEPKEAGLPELGIKSWQSTLHIRQRNKPGSMSRAAFGLDDAEDGTIEAINSDGRKKTSKCAGRVVFLTVLAVEVSLVLFFLGLLGCFASGRGLRAQHLVGGQFFEVEERGDERFGDPTLNSGFRTDRYRYRPGNIAITKK